MEAVVGYRIEALQASTESLFRTLADIDDATARGPSLLPGWTRCHVLAHLARNADAMVNLVTWARTGDETPMYPSRERRDADIEAGTSRTVADVLADVRESHERMLAAMDALTAEQWRATIRWGAAQTEGAATAIPDLRRAEIEIHHVDLDLGFALADLPEDFVEQMLTEVTADFSGRGDMPGMVLVSDEGRWVVEPGGRDVTGPPPALLGYLLGRSAGEGLHTEGSLPVLRAWK